MLGESSHERPTLIVTPRDRFSTFEICLEKIFEHTPQPFDLIVASGGTPPKLKQRLEQRYAGRARFIWEDGYQNTPRLRNLGLKMAQTRLAVCIDADVFVRSGWLTPLLACERETGASLVVPMVLDRNDLVHTAGNDLFITTHNGKRYCTMELRYAHAAVGDTHNLTRREVDFGEVHAQLLRVQDALDLGFYDERYREGADVDSGLTFRQAGRKMFVEPSSIVYLHYPDRMDDVDDVRYYLWKWNFKETMASFEYFREKWGMDRTGRDGASKEFYKILLGRVGFFTRLCPIQPVVTLDNFYYRTKRSARRALQRLRGSAKRALLGRPA